MDKEDALEENRNKELLRLIARGQEEAFASLYEQNRIDIFTFALSILNNYHDAEDVMQEVFISELFNELKDDERQIVVLHLISDLTHRTIAKTLKLPLTTVKWRYRKAIIHLEKISKQKEWEL